MEKFIKNAITTIFVLVVVGGGFYNLGYYQARADIQESFVSKEEAEEQHTHDEADLNKSEDVLEFLETVPQGKDFYRVTIWKKTLIENTDEIIDVEYDDVFIPINSKNQDRVVGYIEYRLSNFKQEGVFTAVVTKTVGEQIVYTKSIILDDFRRIVYL